MTAQHKEGVSPKTQIEIEAMQQQQGLLNRQPKAGTKDPDSKPASWADICSVAKRGS